MMKFILLAAGGALGTILRYSISGFTYRITGGVFPWGTLCVNLSGTFIIGLLWGFFESENLSSHMRNFIFMGILGGFTTFSTFSLESLNLFREGEVKLALSNIAASNVLGLILVFTGFLIARYVVNVMK